MEAKTHSRLLRRLMWLAMASLVFVGVYLPLRQEDPLEFLSVGPPHLSLPAPEADLRATPPFNALLRQREPELLRTRQGQSSALKELDIFLGVDPGRLSRSFSNLPLLRRIPHGEKLTYDIQWNAMNVGSVKLWTRQVEHDETKTRIDCAVRSNSLISAIYEVKDDVFSVIESHTGFPVLYSKQQDEGGREREEYLSVDPATRIALYRRFKNGKLSREITYDAPLGVSDPLGVVYVIRSLDQLSTDPIPLQILGAKRVARTTVRFLPHSEEVATPLGRFTCRRLVPDLKDEELLEDEKRRGDAVLWLEENTGILVKAELKMGMPVGSVSLILTQWERGSVD